MKGVVVKFDPDRGFGFIRSKKLPTDVFVHIKDVKGQVSLRVGQKVTFSVVETRKGLCAKDVVPGRLQASPFALYGSIAFIFMVSLFAVLIALESNPVLAYIASVNAVTFVLYGYDKSIAGSSVVRIPESVLHLLALIGGSPGAFVAQRAFRHKTIKRSFQGVYWLIVVVQAIVIFLILSK